MGEIRFRGEDEVEGRAVDVVEIVDVGGSPLRLFLAQDNRDLLKLMYVGDVPGAGMMQVEEVFSDIREVDGFRRHFKRRVLRNGKEAVISTASSYEINRGLDPEDLLR